jgi:DNA-binding transcriptional ArsR family regulator
VQSDDRDDAAPAEAKREVSDLLKQVAEQVSVLTGSLARLSAIYEGSPVEPKASSTSTSGLQVRTAQVHKIVEDARRRAIRPALPDPRLVREIIAKRQLRRRYFEGDLFADPAWDMLLDLTAARAEHTRVSVTSLCIASGVPPTTALRWINQLLDAGLVQRVEDDLDGRRAFIVLSDKCAEAMARYFDETDGSNAWLI